MHFQLCNESVHFLAWLKLNCWGHKPKIGYDNNYVLEEIEWNARTNQRTYKHTNIRTKEWANKWNLPAAHKHCMDFFRYVYSVHIMLCTANWKEQKTEHIECVSFFWRRKQWFLSFAFSRRCNLWWILMYFISNDEQSHIENKSSDNVSI